MLYLFEVAMDPVAIILNVALFLVIFMSLFFSQRLQTWKAVRNLTIALSQLESWRDYCKSKIFEKCFRYSKDKLTKNQIEQRIDEILAFEYIEPSNIDPPLVPKMDLFLKFKENRFWTLMENIALGADEAEIQNLINLVEITASLQDLFLQVRHYLELGKKTRSLLLLLNIEMKLSTFMKYAHAYVEAADAFSEAAPIGDSIGPLAIAEFIREQTQRKSVAHEDLGHHNILQKLQFEGRDLFLVRAKGPGGFVGKPEKAISHVLKQHPGDFKLILTIDAGLKLEGEETGAVTLGIGVAIGGDGIEKFNLESVIVAQEILVEAIICKVSMEESISTMKKKIIDSIPQILKLIRREVRINTQPDDKVIIAGIGNSIGVGI